MEIRNYISIDKEQSDMNYLIDQIRQDGWVEKDMVIVNCSPEYSSRLSHMLNHRLSYLNKNEPFELLHLEFPKRNMSQVWDADEKEYRLFDKYLMEWISKNIVSGYKYLFVTNTIYTGRTMGKVKLLVRNKNVDFRLASLYISNDSSLKLDYSIKSFSDEPVFFWENTNNKIK